MTSKNLRVNLHQVKRRAGQIAGEYKRKAARADELTGQIPGQGPVTQALNAFPEIVPIIFGHYSECNPRFLQLLSALADRAARKLHPVARRNPSLANYSGALYWAYTRKMGLLSAKLSANFLMDRLPHVTVGAARVASRRAFSYNSYVNSLETQRVMDLWAFSGRSRSARAGSSRFL